jgi:hypothetical protein
MDDSLIPIGALTTFNKEIFFNEDVTPDTYSPLMDPTPHLITEGELKYIL